MLLNNESTIEIERSNGKISSVKLVLPVWIKNEDNIWYAKIPMLNLETYGVDENDLDVAINEVVRGFITVSEKFGFGFEKELEDLDWEKGHNEKEHNEKESAHLHYDFFVKAPVLQTIVNTGESKLLSYELV